MHTLDMDSLLSQITDTDQTLFDIIEARRQLLSQDGGSITVQDFGAGSPTANLSKEQMYAGISVEKNIADVCMTGLKNEWVHYLYMLVKTLKPKVILELGTCCGFSSIYMSKASGISEIHTLEGAKAVAGIARENMAALECANILVHEGRFQDTLPNILPLIRQIGVAFIDGHHDQDATLRYYNLILPFMEAGGIMLFDDIAWSKGMREAWELLKHKPASGLIETSKLGGIIL